VNVHIYTAEGVTPEVNETVVVTSESPQHVSLPPELGLTDTGFANTLVVSSNGGLSVQVTTRGSCASYLNLPVNNLRTEYYAATWHSGEGEHAYIAITGIKDNTQVTFAFPQNKGISVLVRGEMYDENHPLHITVNEYETFQVISSTDLTSTHILSSSPVAVFSGNIKAVVGDNWSDVKDDLRIQLPPVDAWGRKFAIVPPPNDHHGGYVKVIARDDRTTVFVNGEIHSVLAKGGDSLLLELAAQATYGILSEKQLMVVYFTLSDGEEVARVMPSALMVPSLEQYLGRYTFSTSTDSSAFDNYLILVSASHHLSSLRVDGEEPQVRDWVEVPGLGMDLLGAVVQITPGFHTVHHMEDQAFGAFVSGTAEGDCTYAFPAGMNLRNLKVTFVFT